MSNTDGFLCAPFMRDGGGCPAAAMARFTKGAAYAGTAAAGERPLPPTAAAAAAAMAARLTTGAAYAGSDDGALLRNRDGGTCVDDLGLGATTEPVGGRGAMAAGPASKDKSEGAVRSAPDDEPGAISHTRYTKQCEIPSQTTVGHRFHCRALPLNEDAVMAPRLGGGAFNMGTGPTCGTAKA